MTEIEQIKLREVVLSGLTGKATRLLWDSITGTTEEEVEEQAAALTHAIWHGARPGMRGWPA